MESITLEVGAQKIVSQPNIKYLGVVIDSRLSYKAHIITASEKASKVNAALSRIMPNTRGARQSKRALLANVVRSTLMYGAPIFADSMKKETFRKRMATVQRLCALRTVCAFRTVSDDAVCVLAGQPPVDLLAKERQAVYIGHDRGRETRRVARMETITQWQISWSESTKGRWTYRLIPSIEPWLNRRHGEMDYHLTQFFTSHGCFRAYLYRFKHDDSPNCPMCYGTPETAEHVLFECPRFKQERDSFSVPEWQLTPDNLVGFMLQSRESWTAVNGAVSQIAKELRRLERSRAAMRS
jgi:hypothetical protein